MEVIVSRQYMKDLRKVPKQVLKASDEVLDRLHIAKNLEQSDVDYVKCQGRKGENYYRIRVGDWRIGIELKHPAVIIITVLTRGQVYKRFPPK